jgi:hypothetical protein
MRYFWPGTTLCISLDITIGGWDRELKQIFVAGKQNIFRLSCSVLMPLISRFISCIVNGGDAPYVFYN